MMTTVEIHDRIEPLADEWERLAQHLKASPFLWPGWVDAWWRAFGIGRIQILAAYQNGRLAGVLPLRRYRGALSSTTNSHTPVFGLLASNGTAAEQLTRALVSQNTRRIGLSHLPLTDAGEPLTRAAAAAGYRIFADSMPRSPYVVIDKPWDEYENGLSKSLRKDLRRRHRRLEEEGQLTLEVSDGAERLDKHLEEGFRVEESGWKKAEGTSISSHASTHSFYTEAAHWAAQRGFLRLFFLRLDGRAIAFDYCFELNNTHYSIKTGYDPAYARFSPGKVLQHQILNRVFSKGFAIYDMGGVVEPYKLQYATAHRELRSLRMFAPTPLGFLDRKTFEYGRPAYEWAKGIARAILGERGYRLLKRGRMLARAKLGR